MRQHRDGQSALPLRAEVKGVGEVLGLDPLYLANEGRLVMFMPTAEAEAALAAMRGNKAGCCATVGAGLAGRVTMRTLFSAARLDDTLVG